MILSWSLSVASRSYRVARRFLRDARGVTAVEFGLVAFPFLGMVSAIFEIAYVSFESEMLNVAVSKAARSMLTGKVQGANVKTSSQFISNYVCPTSGRILPNNIDCSKLVIDIRPSSSFTSADLTNGLYKSASNVFCPGTPGQIVVVRVAYPLGAIFPLNLFSRNAGVVNDVPNRTGWFHILNATALFQEENYNGSYVPPSGC